MTPYYIEYQDSRRTKSEKRRDVLAVIFMSLFFIGIAASASYGYGVAAAKYQQSKKYSPEELAERQRNIEVIEMFQSSERELEQAQAEIARK